MLPLQNVQSRSRRQNAYAEDRALVLAALPNCFFGNGALSARKAIAELWDGRLRSGTLVWFAPPEEGWSPPEEVSQEAPMTGHLIQGGDTRRVITRGIIDRDIPHTHATAAPTRNALGEIEGPG